MEGVEGVRDKHEHEAKDREQAAAAVPAAAGRQTDRFQEVEKIMEDWGKTKTGGKITICIQPGETPTLRICRLSATKMTHMARTRRCRGA